MLVGIEASAAVSGQRTGVSNYTAHVIAGLREIDAEDENLRFVYFSNRYRVDPMENASGLDASDVYGRDRMPSRTLWIQFGLGRSIARTRPDICHFPNYLAPVVRQIDVPMVVTMYDMSIFRCPQYQPTKTVAIHRAIMPVVARRASLILTVSESARHDLISFLRVPEEKVRVVYGGVDAQFQPYSREADADVSLRPVPRPYILSVGTIEPRKNQAGLIDAFSLLVQQEGIPHHLVIVGARGWKEQAIRAQARQSAVADRIHILQQIPTSSLPALYRGADAFAFPSYYEGFGLPVLEALACGVPTLISNDPALAEVAGDGTTIQANPHSAQDIAAGLWTLLHDQTVAGRLRSRGLARAAEFTWDRCAAQTLQIYREVLRQAPYRVLRDVAS